MEAMREIAERVATPDEPVARGVCRDLDDRAAARDDRKTEQVLDNEVYEPAELFNPKQLNHPYQH